MLIRLRDTVLVLALVCLTFFYVHPSLAKDNARQDITATYEEVKAAFIYNFTLFIEWPETAFPAKDSPITVGVLGDDAFADILKEIIKDHTARGRGFSIKTSESIKQLSNYHIIFIGGKNVKKAPKILKALDGSHSLTISDSPGMAEKGVIINFFIENERVRFEINLEAARRAGLKISAKMLRLARIVGYGKEVKP